MNLRTLIIISFISSLFVGSAIGCLSFFFSKNLMETSQAEFLSEKQIHLKQLVGSLRNESLSGNFRYVRNQLEKMKYENLFEEFQIYDASGSLIETSFEGAPQKNSDISIDVPLRFSDEGSLWGTFKFFVSDERLQKLKKELSLLLLKSFSFGVLFILLVVVGFNYLYFYLSGKMLISMRDKLDGKEDQTNWLLGNVFEPMVKMSSNIVDEILVSRKKIEKANAEKLYYNLALSVAHDIRAPISALNSLGPILHKNPDQAQDLLKKVIQRISAVADDILNKAKSPSAPVSNLSAPKEEPKTQESLNILDCIEDLVEEKKLQPSPIRLLYYKTDLSDPMISGNPSKIPRLLSNLLNNAYEAFPTAVNTANPFVSISVDEDHTHCHIEIRDNGTGISPENLEILRASPKSIGKEGGNGLGLASTIEYLNQIGGTFTINSELGSGTSVRVSLRKAND